MGDPSPPREVTTLLMDWRGGDTQAADQLLSLVYRELRRLAALYLRRERRGHTLQPTALVHELYLRLFAGEPVDWKDRAHFFAVAAQQLRRILVDHARGLQAEKRGGRQVKVPLLEIDHPVQTPSDDLLSLEAVLSELEELDARCARVVELRFFGGLTENEAAEVLGISVATLKRDWDVARAWLHSRLAGSGPGPRQRHPAR